jgi:lipopolysaccharide export system protein LptA
MRRAAPYLLFTVILGIGGVVWYSYQQRLAVQKRNTVAAPQPLSSTLNSKAEGFVYATSEGNRTVAELRARDYREIKDPPHMELEEMELRLFHPDGKTFDLVKAARGNFYPAESRLASEERVEVLMAVSTEGTATGRILNIVAQGASLEIKTGKMVSQGEVEFRFEQEGGTGQGKARGAEYDPQTKELRLLAGSRLRWMAAGARAEAIEVESEQVLYRELDSKVYLSPWSKMRKGGFALAGTQSEVTLDKGVIRHVTANEARGVDRGAKRVVNYAARFLNIDFNEGGQIEKVIAEQDARLETTGDSGVTKSAAQRMDLFFLPAEKGSQLEKALANGKASIASTPPVREGKPAGETKILRSESIELKMRRGGEELDVVEAHAPGTLEFVPNRPGQRRRHLTAERMVMHYAANNQLERYRAVQVETRTEPAEGAPKGAAAMLTASRDLEAYFEPKTGELKRLEQWNDFRYQEGERQARAEKAVQLGPEQQITLTKKARVWDLSGSTEAQEIVLAQRTGEFVAVGQVRSTREPERGQKAAAPTQATAERMESREGNKKILYEGNAVLWQAENRLRAPRIEIDRKAAQLKAFGGLTHQMVDERSAQARKTGAVLTTVQAAEMFYDDRERVVEYRVGVRMNRPGLEVLSSRLRSYLDPEDTERFNEQPSGGIEKAFAYGNVRITETGVERVRKGMGDSGEYYTADGRLVLEGNKPEMVDIVRGIERRRATGKQLSWFANNNKIIVDGAEQKPSLSTLERKR